MSIHKAMLSIMSKLSEFGIAKAQLNQQQRWSFRGIDDVYNALGPLLSSHGVIVQPTYGDVEQEWLDRETSRGHTPWCWTRVRLTLTFICAEDGSELTIANVPGESMDPGDKSTAQALSMAYKYAMLQIFCIPVQGEDDGDSKTPPPAVTKAKPKPPAMPLKARQALSMALLEAEDDVDLKARCGELFTHLSSLPPKTAADMAKVACERRIQLAPPDAMAESVQVMIEAFRDKGVISSEAADKYLAEWAERCLNGEPETV